MSIWKQISHLVKDPPPAHAFELSEAGIAYVSGAQTAAQPGFLPFAPGTLAASPVEDNLRDPSALSAALQQIAPVNGNKRRPAALILPDYSARVTLLDFDSLPAAAEEQLALVRFRVKKTIPFDIDAAAVRYWIQPGGTKNVGGKNAGGKKKTDVVAVTIALEVLAKYEALFRNAGFHPGEITTAGLAALGLTSNVPDRDASVVVIARMAGNILSVTAMAGGRLQLFRSVEIDASSEEEILSVLYPTFAFVEDEVGQQVSKLVVCGFTPPPGINVPVEPLRSRLGAVNGGNAGLLGYLEGKS